MISTVGITVDSEKIKTIMEWTVPKNVVDIRSFLSLVGYYRQLIEGFSKIIFLMTYLYKKGRTFQWIVEYQQSFERLKHLLTTTLVLKAVDLEKSFVVCIDASKEGVGTMLTQEGRVIAYESWKLKEYQKRYFAYDLELIAVVHALKMWPHYLLGNKFLLLIDHRNLTNVFNQSSLNAQQTRCTTFLSEFNFELKHIKGKENKIVNA